MTTIEDIRNICLSLNGVTEDIKWENHLCFSVGDKMFLITSPDEVPQNASFKASEETFGVLTGKPGCSPAPYLAKHKWVAVDDIKRFSRKQWAEYLGDAYRIVASKLSKSKQKSLGLLPG